MERIAWPIWFRQGGNSEASMQLTDEYRTRRGWFYATKYGTFWILPQGNGRWRVWMGQQNLGSYHQPEAGLEDLVGNHCFPNRGGYDTSRLGIPRELERWNHLMPDTRVLLVPPTPPT